MDPNYCNSRTFHFTDCYFDYKTTLSAEEFDGWGWRVPFWISILMVGVSYIIRKNMKESPLFAKAKSEGKTSKIL
jgi:MFS family permease